MRIRPFVSLLIASLMATSSAYAANNTNVTPAQKSQIETIVHDYITKNPQVIAEAIQTLQQQQMDKMKAQGVTGAVKNAGDLFKKASDPVGGNPNGTVTVVEFFDYQCPHCVDMSPVLDSLIKSNPNLRVVYKEFPIRGPVSMTASKAALAASKQGKYQPMHDVIMSNAKDLSDAKIMELAKSIGLNMDQFKKDMDSKEIENQIKDTYKLAQTLGLYGTPAIFIAKSSFPGNPTAEGVVFIPGEVDQNYLQGEIDKVK